jgi:hypothetical protein
MVANGQLMHPNSTYELQPGGKLGVITFPLDDAFFDDLSAATFSVSGHVIMGMSEQSFHLEVDFSPSAATLKGPCADSLTPEEEEILDELNLANTKETGGCNCQISRPTSSLALAPPPPEKPPCPKEALISSPTENELTM